MKEFLLTLLQGVIIAAVPVVAGFVCKFLDTKGKEIAQRIKDENAKRLFEEAVDAVDVAVVSTTQTYVEALKKSNQFNTENQKIAFQMSYDTAVSIMTQEAKDFIAAAYGSLNGWLTAQIEAAVNLNK